MNKKRKFATALVATALLSYGFTLDTTEEVITEEPEIKTAVTTETTAPSPIEVQHLVVEEEIQVEVFLEEPIVEEVALLPTVPTESEPEPTETTPQAATLTQNQAKTAEPVATVTQAEPIPETREPTVNIPEVDTMNGIDYGTSQTLQPDVEPRPTYTEAQLTDPTQTPDSSSVEVYVPEVAYPQEETSTELAYVPGFGWVPIPEPCEVIFAEDMYMNGNKVGSMGGG